MNGDTQPVDPTLELEVRLQAQQWNQVMDIIVKSTGFPYLVTHPLVQDIGRQLQSAAKSARPAHATETMLAAQTPIRQNSAN